MGVGMRARTAWSGFKRPPREGRVEAAGVCVSAARPRFGAQSNGSCGTVGLVLGAGPAGVRLAADARGFGCRTRVARHNLPSREPPGGARGQVRLVRGRRQLLGVTDTRSRTPELPCGRRTRWCSSSGSDAQEIAPLCRPQAQAPVATSSVSGTAGMPTRCVCTPHARVQRLRGGGRLLAV